MLLNGTFSLLGIQDVEAFTARIVERSGLRLSADDREELHVYLIESAWELSATEVARQLGTSTKWANRQLDLLGRELERLG